jgi:hypothetical protein
MTRRISIKPALRVARVCRATGIGSAELAAWMRQAGLPPLLVLDRRTAAMLHEMAEGWRQTLGPGGHRAGRARDPP